MHNILYVIIILYIIQVSTFILLPRHALTTLSSSPPPFQHKNLPTPVPSLLA